MSEIDVAHIAKLARLQLTQQEQDELAGELGQILSHVAQIQALDLEAVEPTASPIAQGLILREDVVQSSLTREEALANAPDPAGEFFRVPPMMEGR